MSAGLPGENSLPCLVQLLETVYSACFVTTFEPYSNLCLLHHHIFSPLMSPSLPSDYTGSTQWKRKPPHFKILNHVCGTSSVTRDRDIDTAGPQLHLPLLAAYNRSSELLLQQLEGMFWFLFYGLPR